MRKKPSELAQANMLLQNLGMPAIESKPKPTSPIKQTSESTTERFKLQYAPRSTLHFKPGPELRCSRQSEPSSAKTTTTTARTKIKIEDEAKA
ncbi:GL12865 [Drosophila persimilis]|uniref:GL12865 n=1 Tax=Drosophila persimilis TaxID=7234 RepID=B4IR45_DROPE|nr:GL12865 [Drosophila persimilis]